LTVAQYIHLHSACERSTMNATPARYELSLAARELLDIPDIGRVQVTCQRGSLWITLDNDPRDIVLEPGQGFFSTEHRRALVYAFEPSTLALQPEAEPAVAHRAPRITFAPAGVAAA
jgi:hypothetical protein